MNDGLYALLGVLVGAASTGTVQVLLDARARRRGARVSARLILNALEQYDGILRQVLDRGSWPSHPKWIEIITALPSPWEEHKHVLAEIRSFAQWVDVSNAFRDAETVLVLPIEVRAGDALSDEDRDDMTAVLAGVEQARRAVVRHSGIRWWRRRGGGDGK
jgi:hypothetical protein